MATVNDTADRNCASCGDRFYVWCHVNACERCRDCCGDHRVLRRNFDTPLGLGTFEYQRTYPPIAGGCDPAESFAIVTPWPTTDWHNVTCAPCGTRQMHPTRPAADAVKWAHNARHHGIEAPRPITVDAPAQRADGRDSRSPNGWADAHPQRTYAPIAGGAGCATCGLGDAFAFDASGRCATCAADADKRETRARRAADLHREHRASVGRKPRDYRASASAGKRRSRRLSRQIMRDYDQGLIEIDDALEALAIPRIAGGAACEFCERPPIGELFRQLATGERERYAMCSSHLAEYSFYPAEEVIAAVELARTAGGCDQVASDGAVRSCERLSGAAQAHVYIDAVRSGASGSLQFYVRCAGRDRSTEVKFDDLGSARTLATRHLINDHGATRVYGGSQTIAHGRYEVTGIVSTPDS